MKTLKNHHLCLLYALAFPSLSGHASYILWAPPLKLNESWQASESRLRAAQTEWILKMDELARVDTLL